jgi:hypothetical protein
MARFVIKVLELASTGPKMYKNTAQMLKDIQSS